MKCITLITYSEFRDIVPSTRCGVLGNSLTIFYGHVYIGQCFHSGDRFLLKLLTILKSFEIFHKTATVEFRQQALGLYMLTSVIWWAYTRGGLIHGWAYTRMGLYTGLK